MSSSKTQEQVIVNNTMENYTWANMHNQHRLHKTTFGLQEQNAVQNAQQHCSSRECS
jgi:hypothetical protein